MAKALDRRVNPGLESPCTPFFSGCVLSYSFVYSDISVSSIWTALAPSMLRILYVRASNKSLARLIFHAFVVLRTVSLYTYMYVYHLY